jgi:hypothetical protein
MFSHRHEKEDTLYENYNQDSNRCHCEIGCCDGIKMMFNRIRSFSFKKNKPKNKNLNSKLLLGDDY